MNGFHIINVFIFLFTTQVISTYQNAFHLRKKPKNAQQYGTWCLFAIFYLFIWMAGTVEPLLVLIINFLLVFLICISSFYVNKKIAFFLTAFLYLLWVLTELIMNYVLLQIGVAVTPYGFVLRRTISNIVMYIIANIFKHALDTDLLFDMPFLSWIRLLLIPITTIYITYNTYTLTYRSQENISFLIITALMMLINYIAFDVYRQIWNAWNTERNNLAYAHKVTVCNKRAAEREVAYKETRRIRHDLNNYLVDLRTTLLSGNIANAQEKVEHMLNLNQTSHMEISCSGNMFIDSLINYKYTLAQKDGIQMNCHTIIAELLPFDSADLCIILGNLIDNAFDAVKHLLLDQRYIELSVTEIKGSLSIVITNPYNGKIHVRSGGWLTTIKADKSNHGLGLESIKRSVDKYHGELLIHHEEGVFRVMVLLYPREK